MCCQTQPARAGLLGVIRAIDPAVSNAQLFWHGRGDSRTDREATSPAGEAIAIDRAWVALTLTPEWEALDFDEQTQLLARFTEARAVALDAGIGGAGIVALTRYTGTLAKRQARNDAPSHRVRNVVIGTLLMTLGIGLGNIAAIGADAQPLVKAPTGITYTAPVKGKCATGWQSVRLKSGQTVKWRAPNGKVTTKRIAKPTRACKPAAASANPAAPVGLSQDVKVNAKGQITGFTVPKGGATPEWVQSLGLQNLPADAYPLRGVQVPQPAQPVAKAVPAQRLEPVRVISVGPADDRGKVTATTEWRLVGGSGLLTTFSGQQYRLDPNGVTTFTETSSGVSVIDPRLPNNGWDGYTNYVMGDLNDDFGQAGIPAAYISSWDIGGAGKDGRKIANNADGYWQQMPGTGADWLLDLRDPANPTIKVTPL